MADQLVQTVPSPLKNRRFFDGNMIALVIIVVVAIPVPLLLQAGQESVAIRILIFAMLGLSWNIMSGFGGMFSFGHAAYFGLGAYTSSILLVNFGISPWIGMAAGMVVAAIYGVLVGWLCFRYKLKGTYFALATFAFAEMLRIIVQSAQVVNASVGYNVPLIKGSSWWLMQFPAGSSNYFWLGLILLAGCLFATILFARSKTGKFAVAIREDEGAASSLGIPVLRYKLTVISISAAMGAVAGVFYTQFYLFIDPDLAFGSYRSIEAILIPVVGGIGTIWGPLVGSVLLAPLNDITAAILRNPPPFLDFIQGQSGLDVMLYAILIIVVILFLPKGVFGTIKEKVKRK
ncbi:MAG: branched-chain amino acid ABC transporter permease [Candidatus Nanopelagicales bacterium]|jgi:branched-chain amino acid transport system permease protein